MTANKTVPTDVRPEDFLARIVHDRRREDGFALLEVFRKCTGFAPVMWGPSIVGFGQYHYRYDSGREGDFLACGFSPRKANLSIYILPGYQSYGDLLARLGKHKAGKSCLYINKLSDVNISVLEELIVMGVQDLNAIWPVRA